MNDTTVSILCTNGGTSHHHSSVAESKACYGLIPRTAPSPAPMQTSGPSVLQAPSRSTRPVTDAQLGYIERLGGENCRLAARYLTVRQASALIDELKNPSKKEEPVPQPDPTPAPVYTPAPEPPRDPRLAMLEALLPSIPEAMYGVRITDGEHIDFLRLSRPTNKRNKYFGATKIQTVHGAFGDGRYITRGSLWTDTGKLRIYHPPVIDMLMVLVTDHVSAALLYAKESKRCCRCNAKLTDERSRKYGIGPECEKHWPRIIEEVDERLALAAS